MVDHQYQRLKILEKQSMPKSDLSSHRRLHSLYDQKTAFSGLDLILQKAIGASTPGTIPVKPS